MKILILGVSGMLGSAVYRYLCSNTIHTIFGTMRSEGGKYLTPFKNGKIFESVDVLRSDELIGCINKVQPDVVINCVGLIKQVQKANDPLHVLPINSIFPHRLEKVCMLARSRLIHISTDCVFSGKKGAYQETDVSDAEDLYGKSKFIGELREFDHSVTLRTSIIGHELRSGNSLVEWFLSQSGEVKGYKNAIFSGVPTIELARIISDFVIDKPELSGLYHVSADPIDKYSLLKLISEVYGKDIEIVADTELCIDRSLDSSRFRLLTGYNPLSWKQLIHSMYSDFYKMSDTKVSKNV